MKYFIFTALMAVTVLSYGDDSKVSDKDMVGTWVSSYKEKKIIIKLLKDGKLELDEGRSKVLKGTYTVDLKSTPHCLEMSIEGETKYAIFEFDGKEAIKMDRPQKEKPKKLGEMTITFKKEK